MNEYKNCYFDKIGYKDSCTENLFHKMNNDKRSKMWAEQRTTCGGWDERCGWNLNTFMIEQIYTWLQIYFDNADGFVDLSYHKFNIDGKEITEREAILKTLSDLEFWLLNNDPDDWHDYDFTKGLVNEAQNKIEEAFKIIGFILPSLWW